MSLLVACCPAPPRWLASRRMRHHAWRAALATADVGRGQRRAREIGQGRTSDWWTGGQLFDRVEALARKWPFDAINNGATALVSRVTPGPR